MSRPNHYLRAKSSKGWESSVANRNIADDFPSDYTKPSFRTLSLLVKEECEVEIQLGDYEPETLYWLPETGLETRSEFAQL